jgi:lipopolysaccharide transport system ATP-binding protein
LESRPSSEASEFSRTEEFWALKDISFEIKQGEVLGIIGRNGAGKSTLLKILSRITEPTAGKVRIRGRVASLLEVGTGFHPELTGRENIYLNGAILGMTRAEIKQKFDEIVAFAEVNKFLDTPVKRYSSGMYVRLAFAVAAHLEPEILVIDEVLAVGDAEFQKKCLGKMESSARYEGRTVLFVSHNIAAIESLCSSAILLSNGRLVAKGNTKSIVQEYLSGMRRSIASPLEERKDRKGSGVVRFTAISLADGRGQNLSTFQCGTEAMLVLEFENTSNREVKLRVALGIDNELGQRVVLLDSALLGKDIERVTPGTGVLRVLMPKLCLLPGRYHFTIFSTASGSIVDWVKNAGAFDVEGGDYFGTGQLPADGQGLFVMSHSFQYEKASPKTNQTRKHEDQPVPSC